ncbi:hypothetical protein HF1_10950 [Mycoplasma haemofelis str. Langford 1]|uniref:Uncharacterized protein n=2 Tax=Mycoplasma haemofelis TaxID=29501 RepID=F6FJS0_MYCHI|nr:hypothetical protein [Mycoplasma haemofelis]AEG73425.1 hypothetical protein MHF_1184 [Mycoplasma haemofelis Ohio2]CBY93103.1 hypothetical protein HF1_10950 [Mycoplasma haemofelis str. Langford 1]
MTAEEKKENLKVKKKDEEEGEPIEVTVRISSSVYDALQREFESFKILKVKSKTLPELKTFDDLLIFYFGKLIDSSKKYAEVEKNLSNMFRSFKDIGISVDDFKQLIDILESLDFGKKKKTSTGKKS